MASQNSTVLCDWTCAFNFGFSLFGEEPRITGVVLLSLLIVILLTIAALWAAADRHCCCCVRPRSEVRAAMLNLFGARL